MKCPACGAAQLVRGTRDLTHTDQGEITTIPDVTGQFCPACDEAVLDADESARVSAAMLDFNKQVNASIMDPAFIASVRKKLALDQREARRDFWWRGERVFPLRERQDQTAAGAGQAVAGAGSASGVAG